MKKKGKIYNIIIVSIILFIVIAVSIEEYKEKKVEKNTSQYEVKSLSSIYTKEKEEKIETQEYPKEEIIENYQGYKVSAKLEIPKIKLETYVLEEFSNESLNYLLLNFGDRIQMK